MQLGARLAVKMAEKRGKLSDKSVMILYRYQYLCQYFYQYLCQYFYQYLCQYLYQYLRHLLNSNHYYYEHLDRYLLFGRL